MIEVEVHQQLRAFLREQGEPYWHHHLTMARLVARALRLGRSALIQAGAPSGYHGRYRLSYLMPLLLWQGSAILVTPEAVQQRLLRVEIPRLRQWITTDKQIQTGERWPENGFEGLLLTTPQAWLSDRLHQTGRFPTHVLTLMDGVDNLESWTRSLLSVELRSQDWDGLMRHYPKQEDLIRNARVQLTHMVFQHPPNPYDCYLLEAPERTALVQLCQSLQDLLLQDSAPPDLALQDLASQNSAPQDLALQNLASQDSAPPDLALQNSASLGKLQQLPESWQTFKHHLQTEGQLLWTKVSRDQGGFSLHAAPAEVATHLQPVWQQQPVVLIGGALDLEADAPTFRQRLGLKDLTCIKFSPDRQHELIQLYLPDGLPMPNTPQFQPVLLQEIRALLTATHTSNQGLTVVLVGDVPLKAQVGSILAAELGSRVQVEKTCLDENGILVAGWEFWRDHQAVLPAPYLLVIATLPLPSLEDPLVAGRVAYYKRLRQDWFRLYLLPEALSELQHAVAPVREAQGVVALLDNRVNHRSYGQQVLTAMSPLARINYVDASLFNQFEGTETHD